GYAAEGALNCLLVEKQGRLLLRCRQANVRTDSSRGKERLGDRCAKVPSTGGTAEQVGKRRRLEASASAECNLREIGGPRDPDAGGRGNHWLLRFANIVPAFQQGGR